MPTLDDLRVANIRKLFADVDFDPLPEMELEVFVAAPETAFEDDFEDFEDEPAQGGGDDFWSRAGL